MAILVLEDGTRTLLEDGTSLLLEALDAVIETSFINGNIDGPDTRLTIRAGTQAALALLSLVAVRSSSQVSIGQTTTASVRE